VTAERQGWQGCQVGVTDSVVDVGATLPAWSQLSTRDHFSRSQEAVVQIRRVSKTVKGGKR